MARFIRFPEGIPSRYCEPSELEAMWYDPERDEKTFEEMRSKHAQDINAIIELNKSIDA